MPIIHYRYANGVVVHSIGYPGEPVGDEGGACFVGTEGRIAVDRTNIVSYPASILKEPLRPERHAASITPTAIRAISSNASAAAGRRSAIRKPPSTP